MKTVLVVARFLRQGLWPILLACSGSPKHSPATHEPGSTTVAERAAHDPALNATAVDRDAPPRNAELSEVPDAGAPFATAERAMQVFANAIVARDAAAFLQCFSTKRNVSVVDTGAKRRAKHSFEELAAGMRPGGDFRGIMFGDDDLDNLRYFIVEARLWTPRNSLTFAPDDFPASQVSVRWAKELDRYVVAEIAFPF